jgi:hypothetical protein
MTSDTLVRGPEAIAEGARMLAAGPGLKARMLNESHKAQVAEAASMFAAASTGNFRAQVNLHEAMARNDFPLLFGDVVGYTLAQRYADVPAVWTQFAARTTVGNFKPQRILDIMGGAAILDPVAELAPYPQRAFSESTFEFTLGKRGATMAWSWEATVDDNLGVFAQAPNAFAVAARRTEDYLATAALIDTDGSGPASWLGTPSTTPLTATNLETAISGIMQKVDSDGAPVSVGTPILMVPPALALTAQAIVATTEVRTTVSGTERVVAGNGLSATPRIVVNPWLTVVNSDAKKAATWFLLPDPASPRPGLYLAFLRGYEQPDVRVRNDQGTRLGGGGLAASEGNFERDQIEYRVRHVVGATRGFNDAVFVSTSS